MINDKRMKAGNRSGVKYIVPRSNFSNEFSTSNLRQEVYLHSDRDACING